MKGYTLHAHEAHEACTARCPGNQRLMVLPDSVAPRQMPAEPEVWLDHGGFKSRIEPNMSVEVRLPSGTLITLPHAALVDHAESLCEGLVRNLRKDPHEG